MGYEDFYQLVTAPKPAAGASVKRAVPGETWERMHFCRVSFTTSAVVANRLVYLDYRDGDGNTVARFQSNSAQAASLTNGYTFGFTLSSTSVGGTTEVDVATQDAVLPPGFSLVFDAFAKDVADQFSAPTFYVCRYPSGEWANSPGATPYRPEMGYVIG